MKTSFLRRATPLRRRLSAVLATSALVLGGLALCAEPAAATTTPGVNATPYNSGYHPWSSDGCSVVPDSGYWFGAYFNFNHACIHHDGCYRNRWAGKATCDWWFYNDTRASCDAIHPWSIYRRSMCKDLAFKYYQGVVYFGWDAYYSRTSYAPMNAYV